MPVRETALVFSRDKLRRYRGEGSTMNAGD